MTDLAWPQPALPLADSGAVSPIACKRKMSARLKPSRPAPPTRKNSRRLKPSHVLPDSPGMDIIKLFSSSIEQKRRAVQQGPGQILRPLQPFLAQIHRRQFFLGGRTVQNGIINLLDDFFVV